MSSIKTFLLIVILASLTLMIFLSALNGYRDSLVKAEQLFDSELVDKAHLLSSRKKPILISLFFRYGEIIS